MRHRHGPRSTTERLRRLLVMLPWLMERGEVPVAEMAARFRLSEQELVHDLELAAMCGVPPYVDELVDVWIDEGVVHAGVPRLFRRPLRLTAPEGFALLAAGRAAMTVPGADAGGALGRALGKLAEVLGGDPVVVDVPRPPAAAELSAAAAASARLRVTYRSAQSDEASEREVTARAVFVDRGQWYLLADDHRSGQERVFRLDRFVAWERTGEVDPPREVELPGGDRWFVDSDLPVAELRLDRVGRWVVERYPIVGEDERGATSIVRLAVTSESWLGVLLLRLGRHGAVLTPPGWRDLGRRTAAALLARYEAAAS